MVSDRHMGKVEHGDELIDTRKVSIRACCAEGCSCESLIVSRQYDDGTICFLSAVAYYFKVGEDRAYFGEWMHLSSLDHDEETTPSVN